MAVDEFRASLASRSDAELAALEKDSSLADADWAAVTEERARRASDPARAAPRASAGPAAPSPAPAAVAAVEAVPADDPRLAAALDQLRAMLVAGERLDAWAVQRRLFALVNRRVIVAATSGRFVSLSRGLFGGYSLADIRWQDLRDAGMRAGIFGSTLSVASLDGGDLASAEGIVGQRSYTGLRTEQTQAVYRLCQAREQAWREKRRVRDLDDVGVVDPRHVLSPIARAAAEAEAGEGGERGEDAAAVGAHHHRGAQQHQPRRRRRVLVGGVLPRPRDVDAESPRVGHAGLVPAEDAGPLVVRRVEPVGVDRRGAHLQPHARWPRRRRHRRAHRPRGVDARLHDLAPMLRRVAAVHAAPGEVDHRLGALQLGGPRTDGAPVPDGRAPGRRRWTSAEHHDVVSLGVKGAREDGAHLPGPAGDHDLHASPRIWWRTALATNGLDGMRAG
jgi:hypothetical protein